MDYENTSSYTLTVTATDGTNTDTETINITINDIDLAVTNTLAASGQAENISIGTSILTSSTSGAEGTVTYSITESDNKFTIDSSTGEVTLANTLDYETATSHTFTVVATDGETTVTETFTLNVSDVSEVLALTANLENTEPFAEGTNAFVASPSLNNPNNETITYTLSGIGSDDFEVSEDGEGICYFA